MLSFVLCYNITISDWITTLYYYGIDYLFIFFMTITLTTLFYTLY